MKRRDGMAYNPALRPRHPVLVAELNDANSMRTLVTRIDEVMDEMTTAGARQAAMHARTLLIGAIKASI
jgi:hypothetical protein